MTHVHPQTPIITHVYNELCDLQTVRHSSSCRCLNAIVRGAVANASVNGLKLPRIEGDMGKQYHCIVWERKLVR